jgi:hypothetical protein
MKAVRTHAPADSMPAPDLARVPQAAVAQIVEFLRAQTDPCLRDRACLGRWVPAAAEAPDEHQLNAVNSAGSPL